MSDTERGPDVIPAGQVVVMSRGAWSDYGIDGVYRATRDIRWADDLEQYLVAHPDERDDYNFKESVFTSWLITSGALEEVALDWWEFHVGDYGKTSEVCVMPWWP